MFRDEFFIKQEQILAVVVIYEPCIEDVVENINSFIKSVGRLLVWQNSKLSSADQEYLLKSTDKEKIEMVGDGENVGIPIALNFAVRYAKQKGYEYLLTMDQDSRWVDFSTYVHLVFEKEDNNAIYGPTVVSVDDSELLAKDNQEVFKSVKFVITSGSLIPLQVMDKTGLFQDSYFIDAVDEEFCYRARSHGVKILQVNRGILEQHFGKHTRVRFFSRNIIVQNYTPFRYYYIVRNHLWLIRSGMVPEDDVRAIKHNYIYMPFIKVLLFEDNKIKKIKRIVYGYVDGVRGLRIHEWK